MAIADFPAVLAAAQAGKEWAVALLFSDLHPRVLRYLKAREPGAADDIDGEVWLAVASRLGAFSGGEEELRAWVFAIARRRLADHRRTAARRSTRAVPAAELDRASGPSAEDVVVDELSADEAVRFVTAALPPAQAEVVLLRVLGGLGVDQVAAIVGKRPGTVRVLQHRALRKLAARLAKKGVTP